jgi:hypothetical protein
MALTLAAKAPTAVYRYSWEVPLADGDAIASYTLTATGCTIVSDSQDGTNVIILISGGTAGTTATIEALVTTGEGEEIPETIYLPIVASTAKSQTVRDVCLFALRKVYGKDETPEDSALSDAIEQFEDMLLFWRARGVPAGCTLPLDASTVLLADDGRVAAFKWALRARVYSLYGVELTAYEAEQAAQAERALYAMAFTASSLKMPDMLRTTNDIVAELFQ